MGGNMVTELHDKRNYDAGEFMMQVVTGGRQSGRTTKIFEKCAQASLFHPCVFATVSRERAKCALERMVEHIKSSAFGAEYLVNMTDRSIRIGGAYTIRFRSWEELKSEDHGQRGTSRASDKVVCYVDDAHEVLQGELRNTEIRGLSVETPDAL
jgi:hypothetical protein